MTLDPLGRAVLLVQLAVARLLELGYHGFNVVALSLLVKALAVLLLKAVELALILFVTFFGLRNLLVLVSHFFIVLVQVIQVLGVSTVERAVEVLLLLGVEVLILGELLSTA